MTDLSPFEVEFLITLAKEQARFERGQWTFNSTIWSRVAYLMARRRGEDRPSPVRGKRNISDQFRSRYQNTVSHIISLGLVRTRSIREKEPQRTYALGYHHHNLRKKDIFLTRAGKKWVADHKASAAQPEKDSISPPLTINYVTTPAPHTGRRASATYTSHDSTYSYNITFYTDEE